MPIVTAPQQTTKEGSHTAGPSFRMTKRGCAKSVHVSHTIRVGTLTDIGRELEDDIRNEEDHCEDRVT